MGDPTKPIPEPDDGGQAQPEKRKKKKKKKKQERSRWPLYAGLGAGGVVALVLTIWVVIKVSRGEPPAKPVTAWEKINTEENEFGFDYPASWDARSYGLRNMREVEVKGDSAVISVKQNIGGSLKGDIVNAFNRGQPVGEDRTPVAQVHEMNRPTDLGNYQEEPAVTVKTQMGPARRSAYKHGSKRGYRATVLMRQTALDIHCECRASDWETLRPAFEHVIESLGSGGS